MLAINPQENGHGGGVARHRRVVFVDAAGFQGPKCPRLYSDDNYCASYETNGNYHNGTHNRDRHSKDSYGK